VTVQEVRSIEGGSQSADDHTSGYVHGNVNHHLAAGFVVHKGILSAIKRVEFFSDTMLYITLRGGWYVLLY
jgi:hypothetical protein